MAKKTDIKKYVADFETTSEKFYNKNGYVSVGLGGITKGDHTVPSNKARYHYGTDLMSFIDFAMHLKHRSVIFFHNLSGDGYFILHGVYQAKQEGLIDDVKVHGNDDKTIYKMQLISDKHIINFQCTNLLFGYISINKMGQILGYPKGLIDYDREEYLPDENDYKYLKRDIMIMREGLTRDYNSTFSRVRQRKIKLTAPSFSVQYYSQEIGNSLYKHLGTNKLKAKTGNQICTLSYFGGLSNYKPKYAGQILKNLYYYDINSHYPAIIAEHQLPYGYALKRRPKGHAVCLIFIKIHSCFKIDDEMPNHLHSKNAADVGNRFQRYFTSFESSGGFYAAYGEEELVELNLTYNMKYEVVQKMYFKTTNAAQKITRALYQFRKSCADKALSNSIKLILNSGYGKFGQNLEQKSREIVDGKTMESKTTTTIETNTFKFSYVPAASYITAMARVKLLKSIRANKENGVYSDTDSMILLAPARGIEVDANKLGAGDLEKKIKSLKYLRAKCYAYELYDGSCHSVIAGVPKKSTLNNIDTLSYGYRVNANEHLKINRVAVKGGYILKAVDGELKNTKKSMIVDVKNNEKILSILLQSV